MFKQEKVIPAVCSLVFIFAVVGLLSGNQFASIDSAPPLVALGLVFLAFVLRYYAMELLTTGRKPRKRGEWAGLILGAALAMLFYPHFLPRTGDEQQAGLFYLCAGFLALLSLLFATSAQHVEHGDEEADGKPPDTDIKM